MYKVTATFLFGNPALHTECQDKESARIEALRYSNNYAGLRSISVTDLATGDKTIYNAGMTDCMTMRGTIHKEKAV